MVTDIWTVARKELGEILNGGAAGSRWNLLLMLGVFGIFLPLQMGRAWIDSPLMLIFWAWVPLFLVIQVVTDSFAGERERHTLETLLASRLSNQAILFGKLLAAILYGVGFAAASLILGIIAINMVFGEGQLLLYAAADLIGIALFTLMTNVLIGGLGVLVSLRAASARRAAQALMLALMVLVIPIGGIALLPEDIQRQAFNFIFNTPAATIALVAAAIMAILASGVVALALRRFQRAKMILD